MIFLPMIFSFILLSGFFGYVLTEGGPDEAVDCNLEHSKPFGDRCYYVTEESVSFIEAMESTACKVYADTGIIGSFHDSEESELIVEEGVRDTSGTNVIGRVWIGLQRVYNGSEPEEWRWIDSTSFQPNFLPFEGIGYDEICALTDFNQVNEEGLWESRSTHECNTDTWPALCYYEPYLCYDEYSYSESVCSGNGECIADEVCSCDTGWDGDYCGLNIYAVAFGVPFGVLGGIFICLPTCCIICFCLCCFVPSFFLCQPLVFLCCGGMGIGGILFGRFPTRKSSQISPRSSSTTDGNDDEKDEMDDFDRAAFKSSSGEGKSGNGDGHLAEIKINSRLFEIKFDDLKPVRMISSGGGSDSQIFHVRWKEKDAAFKCFRTTRLFDTQHHFNEFEKEVEILSSIRHPNCLNFFGCSLKPPRVGIVMEFCPRGDIKFFMTHHNKDTKFPMVERLRILHEVADAMEYLHDRNVIHRDLKPENILLTNDLTAKVIDFGLSKVVDRMSISKTSAIGTSYYMAPEIVLGIRNYDEKVDVYSYSIVVWEVLTGNFEPYKDMISGDYFNIERKVAHDETFRPDCGEIPVDEINQIVAEEEEEEGEEEEEANEGKFLVDMIVKGWKQRAEERPSFSEFREMFDLVRGLKKDEASDEGEGEVGCESSSTSTASSTSDEEEDNNNNNEEEEGKSCDDDDDVEEEEVKKDDDGNETESKEDYKSRILTID